MVRPWEVLFAGLDSTGLLYTSSNSSACINESRVVIILWPEMDRKISMWNASGMQEQNQAGTYLGSHACTQLSFGDQEATKDTLW